MGNPTGAKLKKLQQMLNDKVKPKPPLEVDGVWGDATIDAIKLLQSKAKIPKTGVIDSETAVVISRVLKTGKIEKEQPKLYIKIDGKDVGYTQKEYDRLKKKITAELRGGPAFDMRQAAQAAETLWNHFDKQNSDQWFVAWCIESTRGADLPPKSMITKALAVSKKMDGYLNSGNLAKFHKEQKSAEKITNNAIYKMDVYRQNMIDGGGNWVTALEWTKTGSFLFVGVFAAPVTASTLGTGVLASAIIGSAAVAVTESAATEIGKGSAGEANWTVKGAVANVIIDGGVGALIGYFTKGGAGGTHLVDATIAKVATKLAAKEGFKKLSSSTLAKFAGYLLKEGSKDVLAGALKDVAKAVKGDSKMTMNKFVDNLAKNFIQGMTLGPLSKVLAGYANGKLPQKAGGAIWDQAAKELSKTEKTRFTVDMIDEKTKKNAEALIAKVIKKQFSFAADEAIKYLSGPVSPKTLETKIEEQLFSPQMQKEYAGIVVRETKKALKKKKK